MKHSAITALKTVALLVVANKKQISLHAMYTNEGEYNADMTSLTEIGLIKPIDETRYSITQLGLEWLRTTQNNFFEDSFEEITNLALDIISRLSSAAGVFFSRGRAIRIFEGYGVSAEEIDKALDLLLSVDLISIENTDDDSDIHYRINRQAQFYYIVR